MSTASLASAPIINSPSTTSAHSAVPHRDAELLALGAEFDRAAAKGEPVRQRAAAALQRLHQAVPMPTALVATARDRELFSSYLGNDLLEQIEAGERYKPRTIEALRDATFARSIPQPDGARCRVINIGAEARAREIVAAGDAYNARSLEVSQEMEVDELHDAEGEASRAVWPIIDRIMATRASTVEGMRLKARAALFVTPELAFAEPMVGDPDHLALRSIVADLLAIEHKTVSPITPA